jgi:hypothetical protein
MVLDMYDNDCRFHGRSLSCRLHRACSDIHFLLPTASRSVVEQSGSFPNRLTAVLPTSVFNNIEAHPFVTRGSPRHSNPAGQQHRPSYRHTAIDNAALEHALTRSFHPATASAQTFAESNHLGTLAGHNRIASHLDRKGTASWPTGTAYFESDHSRRQSAGDRPHVAGRRRLDTLGPGAGAR